MTVKLLNADQIFKTDNFLDLCDLNRIVRNQFISIITFRIKDFGAERTMEWNTRGVICSLMQQIQPMNYSQTTANINLLTVNNSDSVLICQLKLLWLLFGPSPVLKINIDDYTIFIFLIWFAFSRLFLW